MTLEEKIAHAVNGEPLNVNGGKAWKHAEFDFDDIECSITVDFDFHEVEDWQSFDWGLSMVGIDTEVDGIADIDVWCHDNIADRDVDVDTYKIRELIDL